MSAAAAAPALAVLLARGQFGFTIAFHILFPAFSIGLASYLAVLEVLWLITGREAYMAAFRYWLKIFSVGFAMGVVSGLVMAYEIGANWSGYSFKAGPILGPLLAWETLTAFFLEAGFLGIMIFGLERVGKKLHMFATSMVAIGTLISATWILMANSWMQTPVGFAIGKNGEFVPTDWLAICFNPSFPFRWVHMVIAAYMSVAFVVGAVGAFHLLRDRRNEVARLMFSMAMWMAALGMPVQILAGDAQGRNTLEYQPAKIAAMEGDFTTQAGQPLVLFGLPNVAKARNDYEIAIPKIGSMILTHSLDGSVKGLDAFPKKDWPAVFVTFWAFRVMVGMGMLMFLLGLVSLWLRFRRRLFDTPLFHRAAMVMGPAGFICILAGWTTTETGRQPWTVYGVLRTADSVAPVTVHMLLFSCILIVAIYTVVFGAGIRYLLAMMANPPSLSEAPPANDPPQRTQGITPGPAGGEGKRHETRPGGTFGVPAE
ncbi:cytochrome ubiquinol oxidase subunit I [Acidisoma cladoniae]|jgi:cytochrome d ubiquinol oxidase subunit I|uniref:cytochrome ubiquinol oxidase subunit I n=1 Tax=Acidisoma cladoniae TaxID=3040935 RepID=UPI00254F83D6|nr:cytochrome ubiquinol oxidase subunit I [Acidisoma sp. PAMC 29798]